MGCSEFTNMAYNLDNLLPEHNLDHLDTDFSQEEIDFVIKKPAQQPCPRPEGFNGFFIKKCWAIVKEDFTRLLRDFSTNNIDLRSINSSIIAPIPRKTILKRLMTSDPLPCSTTHSSV